MKTDRPEMIRCADTSDAPTDHGFPANGWRIIHRAYMDTTIKDSTGGRFSGMTLAAVTVPMPLTPMFPGPSSPHSDFSDILPKSPDLPILGPLAKAYGAW